MAISLVASEKSGDSQTMGMGNRIEMNEPTLGIKFKRNVNSPNNTAACTPKSDSTTPTTRQ